jgi:hypothetical protein
MDARYVGLSANKVTARASSQERRPPVYSMMVPASTMASRMNIVRNAYILHYFAFILLMLSYKIFEYTCSHRMSVWEATGAQTHGGTRTAWSPATPCTRLRNNIISKPLSTLNIYSKMWITRPADQQSMAKKSTAALRLDRSSAASS